LKRYADRDAIHETVPYQGQRRQDAYLRVVMRRIASLLRVMNQHELLEAVKEKKPDYERDHRSGWINVAFMGNAKYLWQNVKTHHSQEHTGGKTKYEVKPAAKFESEEPPDQGRNERP
jgi:hypothetical protein